MHATLSAPVLLMCDLLQIYLCACSGGRLATWTTASGWGAGHPSSRAGTLTMTRCSSCIGGNNKQPPSSSSALLSNPGSCAAAKTACSSAHRAAAGQCCCSCKRTFQPGECAVGCKSSVHVSCTCAHYHFTTAAADVRCQAVLHVDPVLLSAELSACLAYIGRLAGI
jgi:hypothetical protein